MSRYTDFCVVVFFNRGFFRFWNKSYMRVYSMILCHHGWTNRRSVPEEVANVSDDLSVLSLATLMTQGYGEKISGIVESKLGNP